MQKTFNALWDAKYRARRVLGLKGEKETTRIFERYLRKSLGQKRMDKTTFEDIDALHHKMRDTPYQANRVLALVRTMYRFAAAVQWVQPGYNPASSVKQYPERKRRRHMKAAEAPKIAELLMLHEKTATDACLYLWLIIFTGARSNEIKTARWCDVDTDKIVLRKHKSEKKTGVDRIITLPKAALDKMNQLVPTDQRRPQDKIIKLARPDYIWRMIRVRAKCPDLRIHDLRHTFGTYALEQGYSLDQIGEALSHSNPMTTKIYTELTDRSRLRIAADTSLAILHDMKIVEHPSTLNID